MDSFYGPAARHLQDQFGTTGLADRLAETIVVDHLSEADQAFIGARDFFFLSTIGPEGFPTVSYKGGAPGLVSVLDPATLAFPCYDGNGMYLSMGNIADGAKIGMLFIDLERPARLRVQAEGHLSERADLLQQYPGSQLVVVAAIDKVWVNCPRYVHRHRRVAASPSVPDDEGRAPLASWKRIDFVNDVLPDADRDEVDRAGGPITGERYAELLAEEASAPD